MGCQYCCNTGLLWYCKLIGCYIVCYKFWYMPCHICYTCSLLRYILRCMWCWCGCWFWLSCLLWCVFQWWQTVIICDLKLIISKQDTYILLSNIWRLGKWYLLQQPAVFIRQVILWIFLFFGTEYWNVLLSTTMNITTSYELPLVVPCISQTMPHESVKF